MAATLKTDRLQNKTDTTDNIILNSSGATTFGGAVTITSGTINGTTIGASTATEANFTNVVATEIKATGGQTLSIKEDSGSAVITVDTSGNVVVDPASTLTLGEAGDNTISGVPNNHGLDRHAGQTIELQGKITGVGYQSGLTSSSAARGVGVMYAGMTGEIRMYGGAYAPEGWVLCDGSRYDGTAGTAYKNLYDVLGTAYGDGDGTSNDFNVPDMRGRVPLGVGTGVGLNASNTSTGEDPATGSGSALTARNRGAYGGVESVTLTGAQSGVKAHEHTVPATNTNSISDATTGGESQSHTHTRGGASNVAGDDPWTTIVSSSGTVHTAHPSNANNRGHTHEHEHTHGIPSQSTTGGSAQDAASAHSNEMPFMCVNYIIKL